MRDLNHAWKERWFELEAIRKEKMTLFLANVFVYRDSHMLRMQQYYNTLRENALRNLKYFVKSTV